MFLPPSKGIPVKEQLKNVRLIDGVRMCILLESIAPDFGCHVALTGGTLYKPGLRKDIDLLFYRIRQADIIDQEGLFTAMVTLGFEEPKGQGWCFKSKYEEFSVDIFFPEEQGGTYQGKCS